jgi:histone acetyltransferase (RNA polymerase elongator complex component)
MKNRILSIFLPQQGCPNRCVFCNQQAVTGIESIPKPDDIKQQIVSFLNTTESKSFLPEIAFYGGNFTGLDWSNQQALLNIVQKAVQETGKQAGIRISTRPDYIDYTILARLKKYNVSTIELGIQSLSKDVLEASGRGYTVGTVMNACREVLESGFQLGIHLMLGLPKDTKKTALNSLDEILALQPHFIRIHPTLVLKNTELAQKYAAGEYQPLSLAEAIDWCKEMVTRSNRVQVPVARLGLQPSPELCKPGTVVAGPFHSAFGELVKSAIAFDKMNGELTEFIEQHRKTKDVTFYVPARELSIYRGQHNQNLTKLKQVWHLDNISIKTIQTDLCGFKQIFNPCASAPLSVCI